MEKCKSCDTPFEANSTGRPALCCSTACRRLAEFEVRRIDRRLEVLERSLSNIRLGADDLAYGLALAPKAEAMQIYEREIALQTARLREPLVE